MLKQILLIALLIALHVAQRSNKQSKDKVVNQLVASA